MRVALIAAAAFICGALLGLAAGWYLTLRAGFFLWKHGDSRPDLLPHFIWKARYLERFRKGDRK